MSTCDLGYEHPDAVEPVVAVPVTEAAVAIAEIEAERDITLARIGVKAGESESETRIAALEGELAGMRDMMSRLMPEPEPEPEPVPVVVQAEPEPESVVDEPVVAPPVVEPTSGKARAKSVWW